VKKKVKSGKLDIKLNFRKVWSSIKLKTRAFNKAALHALQQFQRV
jgi:hypothetical protein